MLRDWRDILGRWRAGCAARKRERAVKFTWRVVAILVVLAGAVWFLQGINVLPGSFMTGQIRWAIYGGIAMAAGMALFVVSGRH